jgi:hypothetical protein
MKHMKHVLTLLLLCLVAACGGGGSSAPPEPTKLLILGNSLATHVPDASIGWTHTSGMAASDVDHDYAHVLAASTGSELTVNNIGSIEVDPVDTAFSVIPNATTGIDESTIVVIQLGDELNVDKRSDFGIAYSQLLKATFGSKLLVCVSTWWADPVTDAEIKSACAAYGGRYVYIGDIYPSRTDVTTGESVAVATRPHDPSMALIAARIQAAL